MHEAYTFGQGVNGPAVLMNKRQGGSQDSQFSLIFCFSVIVMGTGAVLLVRSGL